MESNELLDMTYMYELAANEPKYIYDVVSIFLETVPKGVAELEQMIKKNEPLMVVYKQAHFLKSSTSIIKVRDVYPDICVITELAKNNINDREEMIARIDHVISNLNESIPLLLEEKNKNNDSGK